MKSNVAITPLLMPITLFSFKFKIFFLSPPSLLILSTSIPLFTLHLHRRHRRRSRGMNSAGRCRVRDLVSSCFNTCRLLPLDSEEEPGVSGSTASNRDVATDGRGQKKASDSEEKIAPPVKKNSLSFAEEDYIVFCFGEDGEIHMINDTKPSEILYTKNTASEEAAASSQPCIISRKSEEMNSVEQSKVDSFESCDSNVSDTSTTSFAFPVLGMEWTGSPAHMPTNQPNAEKRDICRRCCKF